MEASLSAQLTQIFRAVAIHSPTSFTFAGKLTAEPNFSAPISPQVSPASQQSPLIAQLQQQLYQYCYTRRFDGAIHDEASVVLQDDNLLRELSAANMSRERWDGGWQIKLILPSGQVIAQKNELVRNVWPGEFLTHGGPGMPPSVGSNISIYCPRESQVLQPGFYFVFGETITDQQDESDFLRFYWNIKDTGAPELTRLLTTELNRFQIPFRFKCCNSRALFKRIETAVLYVNKRYFRITAELLARIQPQLSEHLRPDTALFTKPLVAGLSLAEDPSNGESFGTSRCRIVAEGIYSAYLRGEQTEEARMQDVTRQFETYGLTLERAYLNPGSIDQYEFPTREASKT